MISVFSFAIEVALLVLTPVYRTYKEMQRVEELDDGQGINGNGDGVNKAKDGDDVDKAPVAAEGADVAAEEATAAEEASVAAEETGKETDNVANKSLVDELGELSVPMGIVRDDKDENEQGDDDKKTSNAGDGEPARAEVVKLPHNERRWLFVHWIVYGTFRALDMVARPWVPSFDLIKIVVIVWLSLQGPEYVYENYVSPMLNEYAPIIDYWLDQYESTIDQVVATSEAVRSAAADVTNAINEVATEEPEKVA